MSQFALDVELVGGPGCGDVVLELPEDTDTFMYPYTRATVKGDVVYEATYRINLQDGRGYYIEG
jgi:hypothetical protein